MLTKRLLWPSAAWQMWGREIGVKATASSHCSGVICGGYIGWRRGANIMPTLSQIVIKWTIGVGGQKNVSCHHMWVHPGVGINVLKRMLHEKYTAAGFHKTIQYICSLYSFWNFDEAEFECIFKSVLKQNKRTNSSLFSTTEPAAMVKWKPDTHYLCTLTE